MGWAGQLWRGLISQSLALASPRCGLRLFCRPAESLARPDEIPQWPSNEKRLPQPPTPFPADGTPGTWHSTHGAPHRTTPRHRRLLRRQGLARWARQMFNTVLLPVIATYWDTNRPFEWIKPLCLKYYYGSTCNMLADRQGHLKGFTAAELIQPQQW